MLIYHPAFDAYHCVFRILALLEIHKEMELEKAQILDFYLSFPSALSAVRWPRELGVSRKTLKKFSTPYRDPLSSRAAFRSMQEVQSAACRCLAASEMIESRALELGMLRRTQLPLTAELNALRSAFIEREQQATDLVLNQLARLPLLGNEGLKARTKLLEYRYDTR